MFLAIGALASQLAGTRDAGAASWPGRDSSQPHLALLGGSAGLAVRLMRPVALGWLFAGRLGLSCLLLITAGLLAGIGAWAGAASQHSGVRFWSLLTAGLNVVPPGLFLLGLGALVLGAWPRRTSTVVYGYLAWSFLIEFAGGVVHTSHWLLDTSVFFHMVPAPATSPDWSSMAVITGLGILGAVLGGILLCRRDQKNA